MKIRTTLTIKNICATATVLLVVFAIISIVSERTRSMEFFNDLKSEAITKAHLYLQNRVDAGTMQSIYLNNRRFINEVEVAIYTTDFQMLYHDAVHIDIIKEDREMIDRIAREHEIEFYIGDYQGVGLLYDFNGAQYIVTAAAYDGYGYANLHYLRIALVMLFFVGLALLFVVCYLLARSALRPIRKIVHEAEHITESNISNRLPVQNPADELGELSTTINDLLARLETAFNAQKQFVSNASHELRTPLAAIIAQLDLALQKERTTDQYQQAINAALTDAKRMNHLIDGLLNLAKADYRKEAIKMQPLRLDELLLDVRQHLLSAHPQYKISILFDTDSDDDHLITVEGNLYLLSIALSNLIDNNCKYSPDYTSIIQISHWEENTIVRLSDNGAGISDSDQQRLFTLFHRGDNVGSVEGHGIGMTLAQKIITLHGGTLSVRSHHGAGTTFIVVMKHI